ncbi:hypothetical protein [Streptomyces sp. NPDC046862]|uniref:hypothetical protein n=1 Tax=Streptomyces sp. NPDC046862 TaxID=3154603 RepID=UPI0034564397
MSDAEDTARKVDRGRARPGCPVGRAADGTWQVHGFSAARSVLRGSGTVQAGLRRRATAELRVPTAGGPVVVCPGELVEIFVDDANTDASGVGCLPLRIRPGRDLEEGPGPAGLAFGDGAHR